MITAVMTPQAITTGLVLLTLGLLALAAWAKSGERDPGPLFAEMPAAPGRCSCGVPHALKPFPGEMLAAPVPGPEPVAAEQDDDTVWSRHGIDGDVWALLRAEAVSSRG